MVKAVMRGCSHGLTQRGCPKDAQGVWMIWVALGAKVFYMSH